MRGEVLVPRPRRLEVLGPLSLPKQFGTHALRASPALKALASELVRHGCVVAEVAPFQVRCESFANRLPEVYGLVFDGSGVVIRAGQPAGIEAALYSLLQWLRAARISGEPLCGVAIEDWPDYPTRGVMLDISRNKVPTIATLECLIDLFAELKYNQLQLYVEHSFAYRNHPQVWADASPLTPQDISHLVTYCEARHIELVPNQNSFGHFHRWLIHDSYKRFAECPDGVSHPFSKEIEPFSLCATDPGVHGLLAELYDEYLPLFPSRLFNVGLDETFDLGEGRSRQACVSRGKTEVYLAFLQEVHRLCAERGRRMMFWGDIIIHRPDLLTRLPHDVIALEWGYEAIHPFAEHGAAFAEAGRDFYVCPGTSSWNCFAGRFDNAMANLEQAARNGFRHGAAGLLNTDWGDRGHLQPLPISLPGFLAGAAHAWRVDESVFTAESMAGLLDTHVFQDSSGVLGECLVELGQLHTISKSKTTNGSALFFLWWFIDDTLSNERLVGIDRDSLNAVLAACRRIGGKLHSHRAQAFSPETTTLELAWVLDMCAWSAQLGLARMDFAADRPLGDLPEQRRLALADALDDLWARCSETWLLRFRPGGRQLSGNLMARAARLLREGSQV